MAEIKGNLDVQQVTVQDKVTIDNKTVPTSINGLTATVDTNDIDLTKWGTIPQITNLNTESNSGFFNYRSDSSTGAPESLTSNGYDGVLINLNTNTKNQSTNIQSQLTITEENKIFIRSKKTKIYPEWEELATQKWVIDNGGSGSTEGYTKDEADAKFLPIKSTKRAEVGSLVINVGTTNTAPITYIVDQEPYTFNLPKQSGTILTEESAGGKYALKEYFHYSESTQQTQIETLDKQFTLTVGNNGRFGIWSRGLGTSLVAFDSTGEMYAGLIPVSTGGTGGKTAADARTNLQIYSKGESDSRYITQFEPAINYTDGGHGYLRYNEGSAGRRAYVGFPSNGATTFTIANEHPTNPKMHFSAKSGFTFDAPIFSDGNIVSKKLNFQVHKNGGYPRVEMGINEASSTPHLAWVASAADNWQLIYYPNETGTFATREWTNNMINTGQTHTQILSPNKGRGIYVDNNGSIGGNLGTYNNWSVDGSGKLKIGSISIESVGDYTGIDMVKSDKRYARLETNPHSAQHFLNVIYRESSGSNINVIGVPRENGTFATREWVNGQGFSKGGMNTGLTSVWKGNWGTGNGAIGMSRSISYRFLLIRTEGGQHYTAFVGYDGEYTVAYSEWRMRFAVSGGGMTLKVVEEANCRFAEIYIIGA